MIFYFWYGWYHIDFKIYTKSNKFYYVQIAKAVNSKDISCQRIKFVHSYEFLPILQLQIF